MSDKSVGFYNTYVEFVLQTTGSLFCNVWSATEVSNGSLAIDLKRKISLGLMRIHKEVLWVGFMMKLLSVFNKLHFKI